MIGAIIFVCAMLGMVALALYALKKVRAPSHTSESQKNAELRKRRTNEILKLRALLCSDENPEDEQLLDRLWTVNEDVGDDAVWLNVPAHLRATIEKSFNRIFWFALTDLRDRYQTLQEMQGESDEDRLELLRTMERMLFDRVLSQTLLLETSLKEVMRQGTLDATMLPEAISKSLQLAAAQATSQHAK
jgi:hypothetical protein